MLAELGVRLGHWTNANARTGCTVLLLPESTTAAAEVRGGAPASRELALLSPERSVAHADAIVLTGGSAFGLACADGVMRYCEQRGRGVPTPAGRVPIVPALGLFDLAVGDPAVRPGPEEGYAACLAADGTDADTEAAAARRLVGAGAGATVGKINGPNGTRSAGIVTASHRRGGLIVSAVVAVNAFGDVDADGSAAARFADAVPVTGGPAPFAGAAAEDGPGDGPAPFQNTTIGVVATNARLDKTGCLLVCQGAHDGLARAVAPPHTRVDGDAFITAATGTVDADVDVVRLLALTVVTDAIRSIAA